MPSYHVNVTVEERNEQYEEQLREYRERRDKANKYGNYFDNDSPTEPTVWHRVRVLDVRLTEAQWQAVQRAVLETFK